MTAIYLDTSALIKRYVQEDGTNWVINLTSPTTGHDLYIVRLTGPEVSAALFRKLVRVRSLLLMLSRRQIGSEWIGSSSIEL